MWRMWYEDMGSVILVAVCLFLGCFLVKFLYDVAKR